MKWSPKFHISELVLIYMILSLTDKAHAQQYNSDSWLSKPHGTVTIIPTAGERNFMLMTTYSLFPKWEFTVAAYLYNNDGDPLTDDGYSASLYAKYMFYQNKAETGGASVKVGTGMRPGTINGENREKDAFKSYWMNFPCTVPLFNNKLSWDLMPGVSVTKNYGDSQTVAWSFTYSTRLAWYPASPKWSIVGEVFGTAGENKAIPEYRIGLRWEPSQYFVLAATYGQEFNGTEGAGFEVGIMLFTPRFACIGGCDRQKKKKK
ncbi:MAG TPA: hypothetical protein VFI06_02785 [Chitinophagaceae bacterium]|nr:hypothetical protein [Chitinophagaceae bacterium]